MKPPLNGPYIDQAVFLAVGCQPEVFTVQLPPCPFSIQRFYVITVSTMTENKDSFEDYPMTRDYVDFNRCVMFDCDAKTPKLC